MKAKKLAAPAAFGDILPITIDPRVFRKLEALCVTAIQRCGNHQDVRAAIASLNLEMRVVSQVMHGHDSIDCTVLGQLLKRTDPNKPLQHTAPAPDRDPVDILEMMGQFTPVHVSAAQTIREVWQAFGRCLSISGRDYSKAGGVMRRASALQPLDVMGEDTWEMYQEIYLPWYNGLKDRTMPCKATGNVRIITVIFRVVVDEYFPEQVDNFMHLEKGVTLKTLKYHLGRFFDDSGYVVPGMSKDSHARAVA